MDVLTIEGWRKKNDQSPSTPVGKIHFRVKEQYHLKLEAMEECLAKSGEDEQWLDLDESDLELETNGQCGRLKDCRFRVYLRSSDQRGLFHLVGRSAMNGDLVYSNAVMIDELG